MEAQPMEAVKNNTLGTLSLARITAAVGVEHFIFISTDKAINPTNVMGASKRLAELALIDQQKRAVNSTRYVSVRFGNVLGSSGSVIPIFRQQLADGGPLTVTDPEVTRFFMTVEEAVGLVLQSASQGEGGEIFVLDMGKPIKILDVARQLISLAGMREGEDIEIEFIGLRAGEKRFEEVQHLGETLHPTTHPRILRFIGSNEASDRVNDMEQRLRSQINEHDSSGMKQLLKEMLPEYQPHLSE
jgi:FlaA1/EpsC-like NDP-sugar epimerase